MPKVNGTESYTQLYQKVCDLRGGSKKISGQGKLIVNQKVKLDTLRFSQEHAAEQTGNDLVFDAITREFGEKTAQRGCH